MTDDPYVYSGTPVLINRLGIRSGDALERFERRAVAQRIRQGVPSGQFDMAHLQAVHRHLFQDVYDWAGKLRTVEIAKDGSQFQFVRSMETGTANVYSRLRDAKFLRDLTPEAFATMAGEIIGDVNYVHPFREGNGRTQLQYLKLLAEQAGHRWTSNCWIATDGTRLQDRRMTRPMA